MKRAAIGVAAGVMVMWAAASQAEQMRVLPSGHVAVDVRVNGSGPFTFIVDTAASRTASFPLLRDRLALAPVQGAGVTVQGASGRAAINLYRLDTLEVDGRGRHGLVTAGLETIPGQGEVHGLLGADVLSHYLVDFDMPGRAFRLREAGASLESVQGWREVPFTLNAVNFPVIEGLVDNRPITIVLDTGARRTVMNWAAAGAAGLRPGMPGLRADQAVRGATDHRTETVVTDFTNLAIGPVALDAANVGIADLSVFTLLGLAERPAMILGIDRLRQFRFAVDYAGRRLLVERPAPANESRSSLGLTM